MGENYKDYVTHPDEKGSVNISEEVIAVIAANAALDTEGVCSLSTAAGKESLGKRSSLRGVRLIVEDEVIVVDIWIVAKMGVSVSGTAMKVQEAVASNIESMTGFSVSEVNVHVTGVALDRGK